MRTAQRSPFAPAVWLSLLLLVSLSWLAPTISRQPAVNHGVHHVGATLAESLTDYDQDHDHVVPHDTRCAVACGVVTLARALAAPAAPASVTLIAWPVAAAILAPATAPGPALPPPNLL